jgi:hypothetical protein
VLLRKCKVLAARLKNKELGEWVDRELNGYAERSLLPDYRVVDVISKGFFQRPTGTLDNADIPMSAIDKRFHEHLEHSYLMEPISVYEDSLICSKDPCFREQWLPDLVAHVGRNIYVGAVCLQAWKEIPRGAYVRLVERVRNGLLAFVLDIEAASPTAGEASPDASPLPQETITNVFHNNIYGNVGNIAQGNQSVVQSAALTVRENDFESLRVYLASIGLPEERLVELSKAVREDPPVLEARKNKRLGSRVTAWLGSTLAELQQVVVPMLQIIDANLIVQGILIYYGLR